MIVETEIWPNLLRAVFRRGVPAVLLSGRLSERAAARYALARGFFRRVLGCFAAIGMQSARDASRMTALGAREEAVFVVGNLKYAARPSAAWRGLVASKDPARPLLVAGSTHRGEEEMVLQVFRRTRQKFPGLSLVLAPRHPERFADAEGLLKKACFSFACRSRIPAAPYFNQDVLLLDTVGELADFYAAADIAFVGGSLVNVGGHNLLEPARFHKPILFGPYMSNFKTMAEELKHAGAAIEVRDADDFARALAELLGDPEQRRRMGERAAEVAGAQSNALAANLLLAQRYL
jgi:3-deoxy-D-manno-octulosonic-acid transferase